MAAFSAAGAVAMGLVSAGAGYAGTSSTNRANTSMNKSTRKWQEYMDNTKYQRTVGDLKAAGLNPMLAYTQGAASPPSATQIPLQNELGGVSGAINSGYANYRASLEAKNLTELNSKIKADTDASEAAAAKARADAMVANAMVPKLQADTVATTNSAAFIVAQTKVSEYMADKVLAETANIKDENARIRASTEKLLEETKNLPLTGDQIKQSIELMQMQIMGIDIDVLRKQMEVPRLENLRDAEQTWWKKNVSPFLPDFSTLMSGANSARGAVGR